MRSISGTDGVMFKIRRQAKGAIFNVIEDCYNRQRLHSAMWLQKPAKKSAMTQTIPSAQAAERSIALLRI